jgi:hypothetical protein
MACLGISRAKLEGARGRFKGEQGACLGEVDQSGLWAISPDGSDEILSPAFEKDFGLLVDLSADPELN